MAKAFTRKLKHCLPREKHHRIFLPGFAQHATPATLVSSKELVCKAHFISSLKKRKNMYNDCVHSWINVSSSEYLENFILTTSSQGLFVWFGFWDCWWGGGTGFYFMLFTKAKVTQNPINVNFSLFNHINIIVTWLTMQLLPDSVSGFLYSFFLLAYFPTWLFSAFSSLLQAKEQTQDMAD